MSVCTRTPNVNLRQLVQLINKMCNLNKTKLDILDNKINHGFRKSLIFFISVQC